RHGKKGRTEMNSTEADAPWTGQRWEHRMIDVRKLSEDELRTLGESGWELVAVSDMTAYFKRPVLVV
ncbi:MAG TPA: hypothetical protein VGJ34_02860, partial [Gaiellaceae bacterium]